MSIFGKIKDAIFGTAHAAPATQPTQAHPAPAPSVDSTQSPGTPAPNPATAPGTTAPLVDVENHLDSMPGADHLNWRTSIVDLMKLLGIDSDYESRKALAQELGRSDYSGSAEDNVWLHRQVMKGLHDNGGKVPAQFVD
jgi:hypothetical protein